MNNQVGSESYCPQCGKRLVAQASYCANCGKRVFRNAQGEDTSDPYLGQVIENTFEILSVLGTGTMGIVYKAYNRAFDNYVALKVLRHEHISNRVLLTRFQREAQAVSCLEHPNIIKIFHFGRTHLNAPYIAMECLSGTELATVIPKEFPLSQERVCSFALQVARALSVAHRANIIHRDLKPANIVVVKDGDQETIKVLDFGIAKIADVEGEGLTREGDFCGTPAYMSPEQVMGRPVSAASDLFSLGSIMYYMLTCKLPFAGTNMADMAQSIMLHQPTPPAKARIDAHVHPSLDAICMKALQKDIDSRYQTADEMIADLEAAMSVVNDPNAIVKPKIVVGEVASGEDLSGETCCEISAYDDEVEEEGTVVEMPAMPEETSDVLRTARNGVASTVSSAVGYALSQVIPLKQAQLNAGDKTIVYGQRIVDDSITSSKDIVEHRKKMMLGVTCILIGCCLIILAIAMIIMLAMNFFGNDDEQVPKQAQHQEVKKEANVDKASDTPKQVIEAQAQAQETDDAALEPMDNTQIYAYINKIEPEMIHAALNGIALGMIYADMPTAATVENLEDNQAGDTTGTESGAAEGEENGTESENAENNAEAVEPSVEAAPKVEEAPKKSAEQPKTTSKATVKKKTTTKKTTTKSKSTAKSTSTARKSASASSDAATSKLKAAQKAEAEGNKAKACSIYRALHEGKEALSQADRVKIMSKVRGCSRITI